MAPGAAGGEGEHGEKHKGGERNLLMALVWVILGVGRRSGWAGGARPATLVGRQNRGGEGEQRENREREK